MPEPPLAICLLFEAGVFAVAFLAGRWSYWQRAEARLEHWFRPFAERPVFAFFALALAAIGIRLLLLPLAPIPIPLYHDEFSYLLGSDTFYHLRLTNPVPPAAVQLESIHINMWPTYQSMYMPGPALLLLFGQLLGCPWISVLLITALFVASIYWMVAGWLPRTHALTMGIITLGLTECLHWWFDNYFCLGLSGVAGALVLGSLPRIHARRTWRSTLPLGLGVAALMLIRPFEGCCVALPCVLGLLWSLRSAGWKKVGSLAAVPTAILGLTFLWLLFYNWRGTGHPLLFPYMVDFDRYHITGAFLFSPKRPIPTYHWEMLHRFYMGAELPQYDFMKNHPWLFLAKKIAVYYFNFIFGFGLLLLPGLGYLIRHRRQGVLLAPVLGFCGFALNVVLMAWAPFPQYAAPAAPLLLLLIAFAFFWMRRAPHARWDGVKLCRGLVLAELMLGLSLFGYRVSDSFNLPEPQYVSKYRARVERDLLAHRGRQLCLVRYTPGHDGWQEWVFNTASPATAPIVWARSSDPETDRQTIRAYPGRQVWLVTPDDARRLYQPFPDQP